MDEEQVTDGVNENAEGGTEKEEKSISADLIRGHINTIILRALYDGDKYGYEIIAEIERKSHGQYSLKQPSLYSALKRLEKDGFVTSYWGGSVAGGRRKYFSLTEAGKEISEQNQSEWEYSRTVIDSLISDKEFDFNNPAPSAVNMRVLRSSTSRVPSRDEDGEDLDYEPAFDSTAEREQLETEYEARSAALLQEYEEKSKQLEAEREQFEAEKQELSARDAEREARLSELENERTALENDRKALEEEFAARKSAFESEREWREKELAARETALEEKQRADESYRAEQLRLEEARLAEAKALREADEARLEEKLRKLEEDNAALQARYAEEDASRKKNAEEEFAARKLAMDTEENERRLALEAEESERRRILEEEEAASRRTMEAELESKRKAFEQEETERRRVLEEQEAKNREFESQNAVLLKYREEEMQRREAAYLNERAQYTELLRQRDEIIENERRAHVEELERQRVQIEAEQAELFRRRQAELIHQNYMDLVNTPPTPVGPPPEVGYPVPESNPADADYRVKVRSIYAPTVQQVEADAEEEPVRTMPLNGTDFSDLRTRAAREGIRVTTAGNTTEKKQESVSTVHKGRALFFSALVVFFLCLVEGSVALGVGQTVTIPLFYPYFIWGCGIALLLVTGLAYANHYGERAIRKNGPVLINAAVGFVLCVIVDLIVALVVNINFAEIGSLTTYVLLPCMFFLCVPVFGVTYWLLTRPAPGK